MRIESGHHMTNSAVEITGDSVRFVCEDGRTMFEVRVGRDGKSLDVCGIDNATVDGVLYGTTLCIIPRTANNAIITTVPYAVMQHMT